MRHVDLYLQEYGTGRFNKKHSTFYAAMMRELGLSDRNEDYLHLVPWQSLAAMNHNFLLTERRRHYLRYLGGLTFFEVGMPHKSAGCSDATHARQEEPCDLPLYTCLHRVHKYNKARFLRVAGIQVNGPSVYRNYLAAAENLGLSEGASGYWALHIKEWWRMLLCLLSTCEMLPLASPRMSQSFALLQCITI